MRTEVIYEWTLETLVDGDIVDSDFSDTLSFFTKEDLNNKHLGLVRNEGNEIEGLVSRLWAYVEDGKLPEIFTNEQGLPTAYLVPKRFHSDLKKYLG